MPCPGFCVCVCVCVCGVCAKKREPMNSRFSGNIWGSPTAYHLTPPTPRPPNSRAASPPGGGREVPVCTLRSLNHQPSTSPPPSPFTTHITVGPLSRPRKPACLSSASSGWPPHTACSDAVDLPHRPWSLVSPRILRIPTLATAQARGQGKGGGQVSDENRAGTGRAVDGLFSARTLTMLHMAITLKA
jgi:hypothetical protein